MSTRETCDYGVNLLTLHSWTAICRGAVLYGAMGHGLLERTVEVRSRISRLNYGWPVSFTFDASLHNRRDRKWDGLTGEWQAVDQMEWGIRKVS